MPTSKQDNDFAEEMRNCVDEVRMGAATLDSAISWIASHLSPDDVFTDKDLEKWATNNGWIKE